MPKRIAYTLVSTPGGVDGLDHTSKGGKVVACFWSEQQADDSSMAPWADVVPVVVDTDEVRKGVLAKLTPVEKLVLGIK